MPTAARRTAPGDRRRKGRLISAGRHPQHKGAMRRAGLAMVKSRPHYHYVRLLRYRIRQFVLFPTRAVNLLKQVEPPANRKAARRRWVA